MALNRENILALRAAKVEEVKLKSTGDSVFIKRMSGTEREQFEAGQRKAETEKKNVLATLLVYALCDQSGQPLFKPEDAASVNDLDSAVLLELFEEAKRVNMIEAKDVDQLEKS